MCGPATKRPRCRSPTSPASPTTTWPTPGSCAPSPLRTAPGGLVECGPSAPPLQCSLGAVAVADADVDPAERHRPGTEVGQAGVVLVARQGRQADLGVGLDEDLPDDAGRRPPGGGAVEQPEAG